MKTTIPLTEFDLSRFIQTLTTFWSDPETAFPLVQDGFADFGTGCLEDPDAVGETPLEWLQHGQTLFAQFTRGDGSYYDLADGTEIELTDDDDEPEDVYYDECSTYGWLISLENGVLNLETAVLRDITGECTVEVAKDQGIFATSMKAFIQSHIRK